MPLRRALGLMALAFLAAVPQFVATPVSQAGGISFFKRSQVEETPPTVLLARQIDELEEELNESGSVVAKKPDVWGESRLTKHRRQVEEVLAEKIDQFEILLNASVSRSDQAYFANALAIQASLAPGVPIPTFGESGYGVGGGQVVLQNATGLVSDSESETIIQRTAPGESKVKVKLNTEGEFGFASKGISLEPTIQLDQLKRYLDHLNELRRLNEGGDTSDAPGYALNLIRIPVSILPGDETRVGYGAEITVTAETHLTPELLPKSFRTLVIQDLVDQLALPVLKIAEAQAFKRVLDQKDAQRIEQAKAHLVLAVETARRLADYARFLDRHKASSPELIKALVELAQEVRGHLTCVDKQMPEAGTGELVAEIDKSITSLTGAENRATRLRGNGSPGGEAGGGAGPNRIEPGLPPAPLPAPDSTNPDGRDPALAPERQQSGLENLQAQRLQLEAQLREELNTQARLLAQFAADLGKFAEEVETIASGIETQITTIERAISGSVASLRGSSSSPRVARYAIPPSQLIQVFGEQELLTIAEKFDQFRAKECAGRRIHLSDARAFLAEELQAAFDFLMSQTGACHWVCAATLAESVRGGQPLFNERAQVTCCGQTVTLSLAWAVLVESALLNERLNEDMRRVAGDPDCNCLYGGPYIFFGPDPLPEARYAFMEYVRCRWPIHVFALDPVNQEQNIADAFSMRRELQLAAAIALATGQAGFSETMRFARRIEVEQQTIDLNRTTVAFAHGANTFGWRFHPRFQTAEIESNGTVLFRDLLVGGPRRDHLLRDYRIEPGMRECVALVVMPSFVPHVRFDIRSNWFQLHDPEDTETSMAETVELSRKVRDMHRLAEICCVEADCYRPGETERLLARVKQLSNKLPLQTLYAQVPYENTAGGFELFSSGVTDLGPELIDFYGAPGVSLDSCTELFLVGKNFSVHETEVIVGNRKCETTLLSRDVMRVLGPQGVQTVVCRRSAASKESPCASCLSGLPCGADCYEAVEVHLATPYGVSGKLVIPAVRNRPAAADSAAAVGAALSAHNAVFHPVTFSWASNTVGGCVCYDEAAHVLKDFCLQGDLIIRAANAGSALPMGSEIEFAAHVFADVNGNAARIGTMPPVRLQFDSSAGGWVVGRNGHVVVEEVPSFVQRVQHFLDSADWAYGTRALLVQGFVRQAGEGSPGIRLTNDLTISLETCRVSPCLTSAGQNWTPVSTASGVAGRADDAFGGVSKAAGGAFLAAPVAFQPALEGPAEVRIAVPPAGPAQPLVVDPGFEEPKPLPAAGTPEAAETPSTQPDVSVPIEQSAPTLRTSPAAGLLPPTIVIQNEQPAIRITTPAEPPRRHRRGMMERLFHR